MTALSVTSMTTFSAGSPDSARSPATRDGSSAVSCFADTLTPSTKSLATVPSRRQATIWRQACSITVRPISTMRSLSSAMAMKTKGEIGPRVGWSQRASASTAPAGPSRTRRSAGTRPSRRRSRSAVRRSASRSNRASASVCISGSNMTQPPRRRAFARYIAASASRSRSSGRRRVLPATAIPMLPRPVIWRPSISIGERRTWSRRFAVAIARRRVTSSRRTANSSPPSRAAGLRWRHGLQAAADDLEQRVAGGMAEGVVDGLELVEVEEEHRRIDAGPRASSERQRQSIREHRPIGEPRQWILERQPAELLLERLAIGDVDEKPVRQDRVGVRGGTKRASSRIQMTRRRRGRSDTPARSVATRVTLDVDASDLRLVVGMDERRLQFESARNASTGYPVNSTIWGLTYTTSRNVPSRRQYRSRVHGRRQSLRAASSAAPRSRRDAARCHAPIRSVANAESARLEQHRPEDEARRTRAGRDSPDVPHEHVTPSATSATGTACERTTYRADRSDRPIHRSTGRWRLASVPGRSMPEAWAATRGASMTLSFGSQSMPTIRALPLATRRSGGTADAADLNSAARKGVRVRISAPAPTTAIAMAPATPRTIRSGTVSSTVGNGGGSGRPSAWARLIRSSYSVRNQSALAWSAVASGESGWPIRRICHSTARQFARMAAAMR